MGGVDGYCFKTKPGISVFINTAPAAKLLGFWPLGQNPAGAIKTQLKSMAIKGKSIACKEHDITSRDAAAKIAGSTGTNFSSNGRRKISLFERRNFNEGSLFNFFFLDERTLYMMVSYSV